MILEYRRRNFSAALDYCNYIMSTSRHICTLHRDVALLFRQLIMLRLNGQECQLSDFIHFISSREGNNIVIITCSEVIFTFRAHKMYDSAIRLEMTCGSLVWSRLDSKLSLALTYLEQYRVEFHQRSQMREEDLSTIFSLVYSIMRDYPLANNRSFEYLLVLGQWYYLTHTSFVDECVRKSLNKLAQSMIMESLHFSSPLLPYSCFGKDICYTCGQVVTPTEVQYVCSGCQVACYCSIEHQQMTWKKEAVRGMRIGHEILCPLYKAYRKYTHAKDLNDEEKEARMKRRLKRECRKFLENGLGLKNKCHGKYMVQPF